MCMQLGEIKKYFCHRMTVWKNKKIFGYNHLKHLKCIIILWTMEWGSWHCTGDRDQEHPHGKERQKSKMAVWEALQIAVKRREAKSKGENEKYKHLIDFLVYWIPYLKCMPTLCLIKSEFGFLRLVLSLRSRSLTKALLWTSAGEDPRSCLTSIL